MPKTPKQSESNITANATYLEFMMTKYADTSTFVDPSWRHLFGNVDDVRQTQTEQAYTPSWAQRPMSSTVSSGSNDIDTPELPEQEQMLASIRALMLIHSYRVRGHLIARFDPLGIEGNDHHPELDPAYHGFKDEDWSKPLYVGGQLGFIWTTLQELLDTLRAVYCGSVGVEFMHNQVPVEKNWIQDRFENRTITQKLDAFAQCELYRCLVAAEGLEQFLQRRYVGVKRFGLEGGESLIPALESVLAQSAELGVEEAVVGMAHRGRLNVLTNVMKKPYRALFSEFRGGNAYDGDVQGSGDVKYHLGASADREFCGHPLHVSLTPNPSHLEMVDPVVLGRVRAKQNQRGDTARECVMGVLIHGDAAFAGQGIVGETLTMSRLKGYRTGGTLHIVVNNQIGFTTNPRNSRSTPYPSDVAKAIQAPIFHVNGDDPEAVIFVARLAAEYRHHFQRDVVIDLFCYRRHGHNEVDEPAFTQPAMYAKISERPTTCTLYGEYLSQCGVMTQQDLTSIRKEFDQNLSTEYENATTHKHAPNWLKEQWAKFTAFHGDEELLPGVPGVHQEILREVGNAITTIPDGFEANPKIARQLQNKRNVIECGRGVDWGLAEALAYGTLLVEGTPVRLSGQDSGRGTFSHRHAVLTDQRDERTYIPLNNICEGQAHLEVIDSPLSEASVLGFEYGYTLTEPDTLVLWEAQFGDFANGAQVIIDQFISAGETKWLRLSGLVMLLPHGYEGQGPEHSSARIERFLQMCAEENLQVLNCSTPANFFHALRRQVRRDFRKPLVIFTPKSLLRDKRCVSDHVDFAPDCTFQRVFPDNSITTNEEDVRRIVLCSGKVYYDLLAERENRDIQDVALVRVEQLYPWPKNGVAQEIERFPNAEVVWCQEEPANMGAWSFVFPRLLLLFEELNLEQRAPGYAGRASAASPATGFASRHQEELDKFITEALSVNVEYLPRPFSRLVEWPG